MRSPAFPGFHELPEILKHRLVNPFAAIIISRRLFLVALTGPERVNSLPAAADSINLSINELPNVALAVKSRPDIEILLHTRRDLILEASPKARHRDHQTSAKRVDAVGHVSFRSWRTGQFPPSSAILNATGYVRKARNQYSNVCVCVCVSECVRYCTIDGTRASFARKSKKVELSVPPENAKI